MIRRSAFSLIELMAVLVIIAILSGAVVLTMTGRIHSARMADVVERVKELDRWTRHDARRFARSSALSFDLDHGIACREGPAGRDHILSLPRGFSLAAVRDSKGPTQSGEIRMECSAEGRSGSYAVLVTGPEGARMWVLFAGLTGDAALLASESQVDVAFASLDPAAMEVR